VDGEVPYLVYEYLPNGTLEDAIEYKYEKGVGIRLSWQMRQSIALDTARGLLYLHTADPKQPLVHRDVKSANVLLDEAYRAKVSDFGLARVLDSNQTKSERGGNRLYDGKDATTTVNIIGTSGYIPKEYLEGIITPKMDVYAFGVILLELLSGLASYDSRRMVKDLVTYMKAVIDDPSKMVQKVDPEVGTWPSEGVIGFAKVAGKCLIEDRHQRWNMQEVYDKLDTILVDSSRQAYNTEQWQKKSQKSMGKFTEHEAVD
jgi:serine/threonine protein kinase